MTDVCWLLTTKRCSGFGGVVANRVLRRYIQVERNDDHPLAWFTPDGKGWVPVDGAAPFATDYEAAVREMYAMDDEGTEVEPATRLGYAIRVVDAAVR